MTIKKSDSKDYQKRAALFVEKLAEATRETGIAVVGIDRITHSAECCLVDSVYECRGDGYWVDRNEVIEWGKEGDPYEKENKTFIKTS